MRLSDAILLDRRLPDGEGLTFVPKLRRAGIDTPIILLTAMDEPEERIEGLNGGADDYLGKPFLVGELLARVRALKYLWCSSESPVFRASPLLLHRLRSVEFPRLSRHRHNGRGHRRSDDVPTRRSS
jgi:DNA-binding response OmpR family regulator